MPVARALSHLLAVTGSAGLRVGLPLFNRRIPKAGYSVRRDISYGPAKLDVYVPDGLTAPAPVLLFFYGGSWQSGSKDIYLAFGEAFARRGIVTVVADYRLYPAVKYPAFIEDGAAALGYVHDHIAVHGGDPARIFVAGHSAGAYIAVMLALNPAYASTAKMRGVIGIAGPYDFLPLYDKALIDIFGGDRALATQPIRYAANPAPPMLLAHGTKDTTVGAGNSRRLAAKLEAAGNRVEVKLYKNATHLGIILSLAHGFRDRTTLHTDMLAFLAAN